MVVCLDEMGPESAKRFPGRRLVRRDPRGQQRPRSRQEIDDERRRRGSRFGAFIPASGAALTVPYARRSTANVVDLLDQVATWREPSVARVYAILDNLSATGRWTYCRGRWRIRAGSSSSSPPPPLSQPARAVVEGAALLGPPGAPFRHLGASLAGGGSGHPLPECPSPPLRPGPTQAPASGTSYRHLLPLGGSVNLPDEPLSHSPGATSLRVQAGPVGDSDAKQSMLRGGPDQRTPMEPH